MLHEKNICDQFMKTIDRLIEEENTSEFLLCGSKNEIDLLLKILYDHNIIHNKDENTIWLKPRFVRLYRHDSYEDRVFLIPYKSTKNTISIY